MSYTAYTAFIITLHDLSALMALIIALILSAILYFIYVRKSTNRVLLLTIIFLASFVLGSYVAQKLLLQTPIKFEIVQTN
jgi:hypothetical protein